MHELIRLRVATASMLLAVAACAAQPSLGETVVTGANHDDTARRVASSTMPAKEKAAFVAALARADRERISLDGQTVTAIVLDQERRDVRVALARADREKRARHRDEIAEWTRASVRDATPEGAPDERFAVTVRNVGTKAIRRVDVGVEVLDARRTRLGLAEFDVEADVAPHATRTVTVRVPFTHFAVEGEDRIKSARGTPKSVIADIKAIDFTDGTTVGDED